MHLNHSFCFLVLILPFLTNCCMPKIQEKCPPGFIQVPSENTLKCRKAPPDFSKEVIDKMQHFNIDDKVLYEIQRRFLIDVNKGLKRNTHDTATVKSYITYVQNLPTGKKSGRSLALDLSGAILRVLLVDLSKEVDIHTRNFIIPSNIMHESGQQLFDYVAECLHKFMEDEKLLLGSLPLGFTFGFPLMQKSLTSGILKRWTKGFNCTDTEGLDVVQLLQEAINRRGIEAHVRIRGIINDTTGTFIASAFRNNDTRIGVIVSTGSNACYLEKQSNAELFDGINVGSDNILINTEWGAFGDDGTLEFVRTSIDKELDQCTVNPGRQLHEKMISGMYMGEIVRLILMQLTEQKVLFNGIGSVKLFTQNQFLSKYVSDIESDELGLFTNCMDILKNDIGLNDISEQDCVNVRYICETISRRAAHLVGSGIAGLLNKIGEQKVTVAIDGAVYKYHPHFHQLLVDKINDLIDTDIEFQLKMTEDGNGFGAALIAAVADEYNIS